MPPWTLAADDHAFANGHAYDRVSSAQEALEVLRRRAAVVTDADAQVLAAVWRQFDEFAEVGPGQKVGLGARMINAGPRGNAVLEGGGVVRGQLRIEAEGRLHVGRYAYIGDNTIVSAQISVEIGDSALLAHSVMVFDNNSHPINPHAREIQFQRMVGVMGRHTPIVVDCAPVKIGARCWIGMNSLVMKGVSIGDDTIVAAGSVVTSSLPAGVIAAGNPAKVLRPLTPEELAVPQITHA